jgi:hypothetical protein
MFSFMSKTFFDKKFCTWDIICENILFFKQSSSKTEVLTSVDMYLKTIQRNTYVYVYKMLEMLEKFVNSTYLSESVNRIFQYKT